MDGLSMRRVIRCVIKADFSADQWGLADVSGRGAAAKALNETLQKAVNASDSSPPHIFETMAEALSGLDHAEGSDQTARNLVAQVVRRVYEVD